MKWTVFENRKRIGFVYANSHENAIERSKTRWKDKKSLKIVRYHAKHTIKDRIASRKGQ